MDEADAYHLRNAGRNELRDDPVHDAMRRLAVNAPPQRVLEVGSSTGWRLSRIMHEFGCRVNGLEASQLAAEEAAATYPEVPTLIGRAPHQLGYYLTGDFDVVILGYFAYLLPRHDLFYLAAQVDRLLVDDGHLIVFDFLAPAPLAREYAHDPDLRTYKADPSAPWAWSPTYTLVERTLVRHEAHHVDLRDTNTWITVDVLRKHPVAVAYPEQRP
jgi:SAM-dependent methyltransferase